MKILNLFFFLFLLTNLNAKEENQEKHKEIIKDKKLILTLDPSSKYDLNDKYNDVVEYKEKKKKKEDSGINFDTGIDKETKSINKVKVDAGIKF